MGFCKVAEMRLKTYRHTHNKSMSTPAAAQMTATMLYHKRFFPYYISNILAGLDENGKGCVYSYDPVGHSEKNMYRAGGSAVSLLQPLLDNQVGLKNMENVDKTPISISEGAREERATLLLIRLNNTSDYMIQFQIGNFGQILTT